MRNTLVLGLALAVFALGGPLTAEEQAELVPVAGSLYATDSIVGKLRYVPATGSGGFTQGSPASEPCRDSDETQFTHILTRNLAVMETEVTQAMWWNLRTSQPTLPAIAFGNPGSSNPAEKLTWYHAVLFANLLSVQQGLTRCYYTDSTKTVPIDISNCWLNSTMYCEFGANGYRLPTEGEWEYFARAVTTGPFSIDEPSYQAATCYSCNPADLPYLTTAAWLCGMGGSTMPVGQKAPNPWNLRDVHGNGYEWCWDWWDTYPTGVRTDYTGPTVGDKRIIRGGCYLLWPWVSRSASRGSTDPSLTLQVFGFRLVRTLGAAGAGPWIDSITSKKAKPGKPATINGSGFSSTKGDNVVYFGSYKATVKKATTTSLRVKIPRKLKKGQTVGVYVEVDGVKSNVVNFTVR